MPFNFFKTNIIPDDQVVYIYDLVKNIIAPGNRAFVSPEIQRLIDERLDERLHEHNWRENKNFRKELALAFWKKKFSSYEGKYFPDYYSAYYMPNNIYKVQLMFLELFRLGKISFSEKKIKVLDIGSAVGTTAWALYDFYQILVNVLNLYGLPFDKLPVMEVDSIEKYQSNIDYFNGFLEKVSANNSKVKINTPIKADVLDSGLDNVNLNKYDVVIASNIINEFPTYNDQLTFAKTIINNIKNTASFILLETAYLKDTIPLKKIQYELSQMKDVKIVSPCGKINGLSKRCDNCYSFRKESLKIPETMKLFSSNLDEGDENEKLKWSYTIFSKKLEVSNIKTNGYLALSEHSKNGKQQSISVEVEIVSGKLYKKGDKNYYYLKVCDQSEDFEEFILKVPRYYELPNYHFGDIFEIKNANIEQIDWIKPQSVNFALVIDSRTTTVINKSELSEPRGLVSFKDIDENNILYFLERFFNYDKFNDGQFDILKRVLQNEDVLGILATGGGKSLTFQLPALLKPGVSIIISPLKSLMDDQVHGLKNRFGFDFVDRIHSGMDLQEKGQVLQRFKNGKLKILYIAPERLQQKTFQLELKRLIERGVNINYFPIDEAHCISEWGHDFRPPYSRLKDRQQDLPHIDGNHPSIIALTATASQKVQEDVLEQLSMDKDKNLIHKIVDRKELSLEVIPMQYELSSGKYKVTYRNPDDKNGFSEHHFEEGAMRHDVLKYVLDNILPHRFDSFDISQDAGLIFTIYADPKPAIEMAEKTVKKIAKEKEISEGSVKYQKLSEYILLEEFRSDKCREGEGARWLSEYLNKNGIDNKPWFSSLGYRKGRTSADKRKLDKAWEKIKVKTQDEYISNNVNLLVTTKGFGMGIDKPNIRYIIHFGFPDSLESYFQQIGRAGRDREHSHCILLWDAPTSDCEIYLKENKTPECYKPDDTTGKIQFKECPYGRIRKCDYAKQIHFIESGYPTIDELQFAIDYLKEKSISQKTFPWIHLKKDYMKDQVASALGYKGIHRSQINEQLLIETLSTLNYVYEFSQTYLEILIHRKTTMREILESTNNDIVKEHIELLDHIYPKFIDSPPNNNFRPFDISDYVQKIRKVLNKEILIDEVVQFFNMLNERDDIELKFNYMKDFGYEIKLNEEMLQTAIDDAEHFKKVSDWKESQYLMFENVVKYAKLEPFSQTEEHTNTMCRRSHIMTVFSTEGAKVGEGVRCDYCDNCGYHNSWDENANDLIAGYDEQQFRVNVREFYSKQSNNGEYIKSNMSHFFSIVDEMIKENYTMMVETISDAWLEQIGESENPATNLMLSIVHHLKKDKIQHSKYLKKVFEVIDDTNLTQNIIIGLFKSAEIAPMDIYREQFRKVDSKRKMKLLRIFSSNKSDEFEIIETTIGLEIVGNQNRKFKSVLGKIEKMEV